MSQNKKQWAHEGSNWKKRTDSTTPEEGTQDSHPDGNVTIQDVSDSGGVSTIANYRTQNSLNHQSSMYDGYRIAEGQARRLAAEIGTARDNFVWTAEQFKELEQALQNLREYFEEKFKELDSNLQNRHDKDSQIRDQMQADHNNLVGVVKNLRAEFERTSASLESKHGEVQKILRTKAEDHFHPNDRTIPKFSGGGGGK